MRSAIPCPPTPETAHLTVSPPSSHPLHGDVAASTRLREIEGLETQRPRGVPGALAQHSAESVSEEHPENDRQAQSWILVVTLGSDRKTDSVVRLRNSDW